MAWVKLDDGFADHPKVADAGPLAGMMQVAALCYCNRHLTDGFIPRGQVPKLISCDGLFYADDRGRKRPVTWQKVVSSLLQAEMWSEAEGGYAIHDYGQYQPSKAAVEEERAKTAGRVQKHRDRHRNTGSNGVTGDVTNGVGIGVSSGGVTGAPVPVPDPVPEDTPEQGGTTPQTPRRNAAAFRDEDAHRVATVAYEALQGMGVENMPEGYYRLSVGSAHKLLTAGQAPPAADAVCVAIAWAASPDQRRYKRAALLNRRFGTILADYQASLSDPGTAGGRARASPADEPPTLRRLRLMREAEAAEEGLA